ncbi:MAG: tetratricopeptide repeat protein [Ahrensia sp.]|nr:tetratricopeptide repeat protein [Ahrensia sp.]
MANAETKTHLSTAKRSIIIAGFLGALCCSALLYPSTRSGVGDLNSEITKQAFSEARTLRKQGNWAEAATAFKELADQSNPEAMLEYAKLLERGKGVAINVDEARRTLLLAAKHNFKRNGEAAFELARLLGKSSDKDDLESSFEWFSQAAKLGFQRAHVKIARHYALGIGVPVDNEKALEHFTVAARSSSTRTVQSFLDAVSKDARLAENLPDIRGLVENVLPFLEKEAYAGRATAAKALGRIYLRGQFRPLDLVKARFWLRQSSNYGDAGAKAELARLLLRKAKDGPDAQEALRLLNEAAAVNHAGALTDLGRLHLLQRFGLPRPEAVELLRRGAAATHPGSMVELAKLYLAGDLVEKDPARAVELLEHGSRLGHAGSRGLLARTVVAPDMVELRSAVFAQPETEVPASVEPISRTAKQAQQAEPQSEFTVNEAILGPNATSADTLIDEPSQTLPLTGATVITRFGRKS